MIEVTVRVPEVLRRYADGASAVRVPASTAADALEALFARWPHLRTRVMGEDGRLRPYLLLSLGGEELDAHADAERALHEDDVLELVGVAGGG